MWQEIFKLTHRHGEREREEVNESHYSVLALKFASAFAFAFIVWFSLMWFAAQLPPSKLRGDLVVKLSCEEAV